MKEEQYEEWLTINTTGEQTWKEIRSPLYYPYQFTPYGDLDRLFSHYPIETTDCVVDFGSGKGRVPIYLHCRFGIKVVGVEMDEGFHGQAVENKKRYLESHGGDEEELQLICHCAEDYEIKQEENRFYFFNPFGVQIFRKVVEHILASVKEYPRMVELILYYPATDCTAYLKEETSFRLVQEVVCEEGYIRDEREKFLIYRVEQ